MTVRVFAPQLYRSDEVWLVDTETWPQKENDLTRMLVAKELRVWTVLRLVSKDDL